MKKLFILLLLASVLFISCSDDDDDNRPEYVMLDLSNFDLSDGVPTVFDKDGNPVKTDRYWKDTYNTGKVNIKSQIFKFSHTATSGQFPVWDGFTVSNVKDNSNHSESNRWVENQWGCMAKGGQGSEGSPFAIGYISEKTGYDDENASFAEGSYTAWIKIDDTSNKYKVKGAYICNHPWTYYSATEGDKFSPQFKSGNYLILNIYGVKNKTISKPVEYYLIDYRSTDQTKWKAGKSWEWVDLESLGEVDYIFFKMKTDVMINGYSNVPLYFCLDKLSIEKVK